MSLPAKTIATVAIVIPLLMGAIHDAQAFSCNPPPANAAPCGNTNTEFQSCGINVPVGGGALPVARHYCIHVPAAPASQSFR
jgi:hypothetical protein